VPALSWITWKIKGKDKNIGVERQCNLQSTWQDAREIRMGIYYKVRKKNEGIKEREKG